MLIIGLTGGIGSGKSVVSQLFAEKNIPIIDADLIARELTQTGSTTLQVMIDHFKPNILLKDKALDRRKLRQIIFSDPQERLWLEKYLHPKIKTEIIEQIQKLKSPYAIIVVPLLIEVKPYPFINRILVIDATEKSQIERVIKRDQLTEKQVKAIIQSQASRETRSAFAQDIIFNDGSLQSLTQQVDHLHQVYINLSKNEV